VKEKKEYIQEKNLKDPLIASVKLTLSYIAVFLCGNIKQEMMLPTSEYVSRAYKMFAV
jgi:hypothetical protein